MSRVALIKPLVFGLGLLASWLIWHWGFSRFYVDPNFMAVITAKNGLPLPPDQILAQPGQQGIQAQVLGEGRHFLNPYLFEYKIVPTLTIPAGKVGVVTSKVGTTLPPGTFLAKWGQKGILREVLGPGKYRLNPYGYQVDLVDAISIPIGFVGVLTSLSGQQPSVGSFAKQGQKGVRKDILQPGLYYVNPREIQVDVLETGLNQVSLLGKTGSVVITKAQLATQNVAMEHLQNRLLAVQKENRKDYLSQRLQIDQKIPITQGRTPTPAGQALDDNRLTLNQLVAFPSRDGFEISLDMTVEFELVPKHIAWLYRSYGDLPAVVDNIIMPQILSVSRLKGSDYRAKDFIVGEGREKFQAELTESLRATLVNKRIKIHNALIRQVNVPQQILDPIQQASIARENDLTNQEKQNTVKKQAELNTETGMIEQRRQQVVQETHKLKAGIRADQERQVARIQAESNKRVAEIEHRTAQIHAERIRTLGYAKAQATRLIEGEKAKGYALKAQTFRDSTAFSLWEFAKRLNRDIKIKILPTGPGTLWTDLEGARLGDLNAERKKSDL